jgi:hypothetical protein
VQALRDAAQVVTERADVAAVARRQHDQPQRPGVGREDLAQPPGVDRRDPAGYLVVVEREPERAAGDRAVTQQVQDPDRPALPGRLGQPLRQPAARRVGQRVVLGVERPAPRGARLLDRRLVLGRRDVPGPREQQPPGARLRRPRHGLGVRPLVAHQHARELADVLPGGLDRQQLPGQRVELGGGGPERHHDRPLLLHGVAHLRLEHRPLRRRQELAQPVAQALDHHRIAAGLLDRRQVGEQRLVPRERRLGQAAAGAVQPVGLRREHELERALGVRGPRQLQHQREWICSRHSPCPG